MSHARRRLVLSVLSIFTLTGGTYAWAQDGGWAGVQEIKCYAENCDGTLCVRQQIVCPKTIIPVD